MKVKCELLGSSYFGWERDGDEKLRMRCCINAYSERKN